MTLPSCPKQIVGYIYNKNYNSAQCCSHPGLITVNPAKLFVLELAQIHWKI